MIADPNMAKAAKLRDLAFELETLADRVMEPSRSTVRSELIIAEGERISAAVRSVFRGRG